MSRIVASFDIQQQPRHKFKWKSIYVYIRMSVCFFPINVKTVEPIGSKFCVGPNMTPGKLCGSSKFQKQVSNKIRFLSNFKIRKLFFIVLQCIHRENVYNWKWNMGANRLESLIMLYDNGKLRWVINKISLKRKDINCIKKIPIVNIWWERWGGHKLARPLRHLELTLFYYYPTSCQDPFSYTMHLQVKRG